MRSYHTYFQKTNYKEDDTFFHTLENRSLKVEHIDVALKVRSQHRRAATLSTAFVSLVGFSLSCDLSIGDWILKINQKHTVTYLGQLHHTNFVQI